MVLHFAASPVSEDFNSKVLVFFQEIIDFKGQIMFLIPEEYFEQLIISHSFQLFISNIPEEALPEVIDDSQKFRNFIDVVIADHAGG